MLITKLSALADRKCNVLCSQHFSALLRQQIKDNQFQLFGIKLCLSSVTDNYEVINLFSTYEIFFRLVLVFYKYDI